MKTFKQFVKIKEDSAMDVGRGAIGHTSLSTGEEETTSALFTIASYLYGDPDFRGSFEDLINRAANKSEEVKSAWEEFQRDPGAGRRAARKTTRGIGDRFGSDNEVKAPGADTPEGEGDEF